MLRPSHASTEALLRAAKPMDFDGTTLKLGVYYKFHKEHLESNSHRVVLEDTLASLVGAKVKVVCILTEPSVIPSKTYDNNFTNTGGGVLLTEPTSDIDLTKTDIPNSDSVLTDDKQNDIMSLAEKIFNN
jgi:hypothetical protein